ncbi:helix-turn-helix transcriptional regulator [Lacihabitans sp. CS3-21]|jgi:DNA-binding NarL/FixJ family response regulator|uniref:helix-turn-helix domain-containing protein n=1 Tax=Lacihabitans sp. CS3-21 TaxID=2487332 RepID=UPI002883AFF5|nr:LuxR family transcriptional regulator [Lacihabitans sp. CS3-21]
MNSITTLTNQEIKIISLILEGLKSRQIAEKLFIIRPNVKNHKTNICVKLD